MKKMKILMFDMILHFKFIYNPENYNYDSPNNPSNCDFTLTKTLVVDHDFSIFHANTSYRDLIYMTTSLIYRYPPNSFMVIQYKCSTI
jgi:hypothetical protein